MTRNSISRRRFLGASLAGAAALTISPVPVLSTARAATSIAGTRFLVVINLVGGNDGVNTLVPTHLQPYYDRRPTLALTSGLHDLDGSNRLHPSLSFLKEQWDGSELQVIQKVGYPQMNQSHFTSRNIFSYGVREFIENGDGRGWLGRFADTYCADPAEPLGVVSVGMGRVLDLESLEGESLALDTVSGFDLLPDYNFRTDHDLRVRVARRILAREQEPEGGAALEVFGTGRQAHTLVERVKAGVVGWEDPGDYPTTTIGRRLKVVSELLQGYSDFGTKIFYTGMGGFDTHADQAGRHADLLTQLDDALRVFAADLRRSSRNLWDDCSVLVISEFGRRNEENGSNGTDHGMGNCFFVTGGTVDRSAITGDLVDADLLERQPGYSYDFRELYSDLIENHIGASAAPIFPEPYQTTGDISVTG